MTRPAGQPQLELDRLRELLLRPEADRLSAVEGRVDRLDVRLGSPERLESATAEILVEAFRAAEIARHRELANAVAPVVVAAIRSEIQNSRDMMVEALYPITGRLVAAAVANAFRDLVADLNERLDRTLSTRHWKLRFQALATGRSISELALAQVQAPVLRRLLLLERGSGRLIASWHAAGEEDSQSELVSGLIAAITEFASSVYGARSGELRTLDLGEARVFLRGAPLYLVAAECAGALRPEHERELDDAFLSLISRIGHAPDEAQPALAHMAGVLFQAPAQGARKPGLPLIALAAAVVAFGAWLASGPVLRGLHERRIDAAFAAAIRAQPALEAYPLRLSVDHAAHTATLAGLAPSEAVSDELAAALAGPAAPYKVATHVASVGSIAQLQDLRARMDAVGAQIGRVEGGLAEADRRIDDLRRRMESNAATLAAGQAEARALRADSAAIRGQIASLGQQFAPSAWTRAATVVARTAIYFSKDDVFADPDLAARRADEIAAALKDGDFTLHVIGHTDASGGEQRNREIARQRAEAVSRLLAAHGVAPARLRTLAAPEQVARAPKGDARDRRVTFALAPLDERQP